MRVIPTILLFFLISASSHGAMNPLVGCLGQEELKFHKKKYTGPVYKLNQLFLNDLVSAGDITLKSEYFERVCTKPVFTPSVDLMREILINGEKIFMLSNRVSNASIRNFQRSAITEIQRLIPHIFFSYLSDLQSQTATHDCLGKYIPEIKYFQGRFKYLENEIGSSSLMQEKSKIKKIFSSLRGFNSIQKKCLNDKKARDKKLKSKTKS